MAIRPHVTVVETPQFLERIVKLMAEGEREQLIACLAANPTAVGEGNHEQGSR